MREINLREEIDAENGRLKAAKEKGNKAGVETSTNYIRKLEAALKLLQDQIDAIYARAEAVARGETPAESVSSASTAPAWPDLSQGTPVTAAGGLVADPALKKKVSVRAPVVEYKSGSVIVSIGPNGVYYDGEQVDADKTLEEMINKAKERLGKAESKPWETPEDKANVIKQLDAVLAGQEFDFSTGFGETQVQVVIDKQGNGIFKVGGQVGDIIGSGKLAVGMQAAVNALVALPENERTQEVIEAITTLAAGLKSLGVKPKLPAESAMKTTQVEAAAPAEANPAVRTVQSEDGAVKVSLDTDGARYSIRQSPEGFLPRDGNEDDASLAKRVSVALEKVAPRDPAVQGVRRKLDAVGGINLSEDNLTINIKVDGAGMPLPAQFQDPAMTNIQGLSPIIREIAPANSVNMPVLSELMQMAGSAAA